VSDAVGLLPLTTGSLKVSFASVSSVAEVGTSGFSFDSVNRFRIGLLQQLRKKIRNDTEEESK
jgi:hypothetical protein